MPRPRHLAAVWSVSVAAALAAGGCGRSDNPDKQSRSSVGSGNALSAEAQSAATGDIPDNQAFLVLHNRPAGYSIKYPEGWTQVGAGKDATFKDKDNVVRVGVGPGTALSTRQAAAELTKLERSDRSLVVTSRPKQVTVKGIPMIKSGYAMRSTPNPVTGKRIMLLVDRYQLAHNGKLATVDLRTPKGVDNVDAYRLIIESFRWR